MSGFNLFTYGTLRAGGIAHGLLEGCDTLGSATLSGVLYDIDDQFPALLLYGDARVHGELYRCPAALLSALDEYEGTSKGMFRRVGAEAVTADGETTPCWVYAAGPTLSHKLTPECRLRDGFWPWAATPDRIGR